MFNFPFYRNDDGFVHFGTDNNPYTFFSEIPFHFHLLTSYLILYSTLFYAIRLTDVQSLVSLL
jgi:hypothetical protein